VGGGIVDLVTLNRVVWSEIPEREEAGSPNVLGVVALDAAVTALTRLGMDEIARHEAALTEYLFRRVAEVPGLLVLGRPTPAERVGLISFVLPEASGYLVAAVLGYEFGVGVRAGCFCAHPGMMHLLGVQAEQVSDLEQAILQRKISGATRASLGLYNSAADVDALVEALQAVVSSTYRGNYRRDPATGDYLPTDWDPRLSDYFGVAG